MIRSRAVCLEAFEKLRSFYPQLIPADLSSASLKSDVVSSILNGLVEVLLGQVWESPVLCNLLEEGYKTPSPLATVHLKSLERKVVDFQTLSMQFVIDFHYCDIDR